jgi:N-acetylmuramoyl-L-alanine amidase/FlgD Ig-like domain
MLEGVARALTIALFCLLVGSPAVKAEEAAIVARDLPVGAARSLASFEAPIKFDLVGVHWRGEGTVAFRTRAVGGRWSRWQTVDDGDRSDLGAGEARAAGRWRLGSPVWTGPSDRFQYRAHGAVRRVRVYYVRSAAEHRALRSLSTAGSPPIVSRAVWGGNELPRRSKPRYAPSVRFVVVHHTATSNDYTPDEAAAIVRAIDVYHVKGNGWDDVGYNFLVDRYGHVFEGRYGGIARNVIGAHALGFNTGSVGIALIGNYLTARPTAVQLQALERLIAWRLDLAHIDPVSTLTYISNGSERYRRGTKVTLRAVSGHRDTGRTSCPGGTLYRQLDQIAVQAESIGLPKLYSPRVRGGVGGPVSFAARLSSALAWTVTVIGPDGATVAQGSGFGSNVAWTWQSAGRAKGRYVWTIEAGPSVLPARGVVGGGSLPSTSGPLVKDLAVSPPVVSPNGDGYAETGGISYSLTAAATVTATVAASTGAVVATVLQAKKQAPRAFSLSWSPAGLPDGLYAVTVSAFAADGRRQALTADLTVDRVLSSVTANPLVVSPNGDGLDDTVAFAFALAGPGEAAITVLGPDGSPVVTVFAGPLQAGAYSFGWNGLGPDGSPAPAGHYQVSVSVVDALATVTQTAPFDVA